jgi:hypothetical protein
MSGVAGPGPHYQPYDSDEETESSSSESQSGSSTASTTPEPTATATHDGRMQALDTWRVAAQQWISAPGRAPVSDRVTPVRPQPVLAAPAAPATGNLHDLPSELRANDIRRYVLHVDSRFRESPFQSTAADFYLRPLAPIKNVLRVRVVSVELPYTYPFFTARRRNVTLTVSDQTVSPAAVYSVTLPTGNYTPAELATEITTLLAAAGAGWLSLLYDAATNRFTFVSLIAAWSIDTTVGSWDRPFDYGLGYYLGIPRAVVDVSGSFEYAPPGCAVVGGDNYLFLKINDFDCIYQPVSYVTPTTPLSNHEFTALAKVRLRADRNAVAFDDYAGQVLKEVVFFSPRDIPRLHVQILDAYGEVVDLCTAEFSVALEILEIQSTTLFESVRDSLMMNYA